MPIYDMLARRVDGRIHVKVADDDWRPVDGLPLRLVSVYVNQSFNSTMRAITGTLHAVVEYVEERRPSEHEEWAAGWVHGELIDNASDDMSFYGSDGASKIVLKSKRLGKFFQVTVVEVVLKEKG